MSTGNQSCLRFSLEESVWFQRGQEVAELISISLDPNITIQENDQYVTIKGSLDLTGEYTCDDREEEGSEEQFAARFIHSVSEREEGQLEFLHRFPVDITIPQNRIESIYDIDISVESFDYDFPERGSLKLSAELAITGLYGDQQHGNEEIDDSEEPVELAQQVEITELEPLYRQTETVEAEAPDYPAFAVTPQEESPLEVDNTQEIAGLYEPFQAEARKEPEIAAVEMNNKESDSKPRPEPIRVIQENPFAALVKEQAKQTPIERFDTTPQADTEVPEITEEPIVEGEPIEHEDERQETEPVLVEQEEQKVQQAMIINEKAQLSEEESSSSSSSEQETPKVKKGSKKKSLSIAEFLARKEESEVTKIRVCIVQQDDTLELIADRYEVSVQQLISINHLDLDQEVSDGQVLYIPAEYAARRSK